MSANTSPYQILERALKNYRAGYLSHEELLLVVEGQGRLVESWITELKAVRENRFEALRAYQERCLEGYRTLMQGLKLAYAAINRRDRDFLDHARTMLRQGETLTLATIAA